MDKYKIPLHFPLTVYCNQRRKRNLIGKQISRLSDRRSFSYEEEEEKEMFCVASNCLKLDIVSPATLSFIGAWLQRVKSLINVRNLPNTTVLFVLVNGLTSGMNRGRMVLSRVLCDCDHILESR